MGARAEWIRSTTEAINLRPHRFSVVNQYTVNSSMNWRADYQKIQAISQEKKRSDDGLIAIYNAACKTIVRDIICVPCAFDMEGLRMFLEPGADLVTELNIDYPLEIIERHPSAEYAYIDRTIDPICFRSLGWGKGYFYELSLGETQICNFDADSIAKAATIAINKEFRAKEPELSEFSEFKIKKVTSTLVPIAALDQQKLRIVQDGKNLFFSALMFKKAFSDDESTGFIDGKVIDEHLNPRQALCDAILSSDVKVRWDKLTLLPTMVVINELIEPHVPGQGRSAELRFIWVIDAVDVLCDKSKVVKCSWQPVITNQPVPLSHWAVLDALNTNRTWCKQFGHEDMRFNTVPVTVYSVDTKEDIVGARIMTKVAIRPTWLEFDEFEYSRMFGRDHKDYVPVLFSLIMQRLSAFRSFDDLADVCKASNFLVKRVLDAGESTSLKKERAAERKEIATVVGSLKNRAQISEKTEQELTAKLSALRLINGNLLVEISAAGDDDTEPATDDSDSEQDENHYSDEDYWRGINDDIGAD